MGWVVFIAGCLITIPVGWLLFARTKGDRFLTAFGLILLPPTIWAAGIGLSIGPCDTPTCVTTNQQDLLKFSVAGLVVLVLALAAVGTRRTIPAAVLMFLACLLNMVGAWKIDRVTAAMFVLLGIAVAVYFVLSLLPNRPGAQASAPSV